MARFFNTAGPCLEGRHYMLPPERRVPGIDRLVDQGLYFVLHAPRQSGKTTWMHTLTARLRREGAVCAVAANVEPLQRTADLDRAIPVLITILREGARGLPEAEQPPAPTDPPRDPLLALKGFLEDWAAACPRPLVLLIDEIDSLPEDVLISVLRQLRAGYTARPAPFPHSVGLIGLRDVRDYAVQLRPNAASMGTASPFNVKAETLTLGSFSEGEVVELYGQHTADTGQVFTPQAAARAFQLTAGQPWLVNALARQIIEHQVPDRTAPITEAHIDAARDALILRRDTHLDSLIDKLREPRVQRIIEPILAGTPPAADVLSDDLAYVRDLGIIAPDPPVRLANPIYQEVIPRTLTWLQQQYIDADPRWYVRADGQLDMPRLLKSFQAFYAEHSEAWLARHDYQEAGPHLILMAFLQRIVNGGGRIQRELAVGSGRVDLCVEFAGARHALELKVWRGPSTLKQGKAQLGRYLERLGLEEGYLILFDRRPEVPWEQKLYQREERDPSGRRIHLVGV